ncbi:MAG: methionine sulfoxide reductase [Rhodospirillales bacterium]|nr:methionine sulfoxide reductase [Rhodospirillales bacterium]
MSIAAGLFKSFRAASALALILGLSAYPQAVSAETAQLVPPPQADLPAAGGGMATAVLAGGCFWGVQGVFEHVKGVDRVLSGYAGGTAETASYETVNSGRTGHAESVEIQFDPKTISYGQILQIFFSVALDPTEVNRQGPDSGPQYRSEVFVRDEAQQKVAQSYIAQLDQAGIFRRPIATKVDKLDGFYPAEAYHQDYLLRHPESLYIVVNDMPKIANLKRLFPAVYQETPVTVPPAARSGS